MAGPMRWGSGPAQRNDWDGLAPRQPLAEAHNGHPQLFSPPISGAGLPPKHEGKDYVYQEGCSLIVNYLPASMTNEELHSLFSVLGEIQSCKVMLDPKSKTSKGFGFVNYVRRDDAEKAIRNYNGLRLQSKTLKVSFARPSSDEIKNTNVYISGLTPTFTQKELEDMFAPYGTIITSTLLRDGNGVSRGQGLVRFNVKSEADQAIAALNETTPENCPSPVSVRFANPPTSKNSGPNGNMPMMSPPTSPPPMPMQSPMPPPPPMGMGPGSPPGGGGPIRGPMRVSGMRFSPMDKSGPPSGGPMHSGPAQLAQIYVCPLDADADDIDLYRLFSPYGAIQSARVIKDPSSGQCKGFGFINMIHQQEACVAVQSLNGAQHKGKPLSVSFKIQKKM